MHLQHTQIHDCLLSISYLVELNTWRRFLDMFNRHSQPELCISVGSWRNCFFFVKTTIKNGERKNNLLQKLKNSLLKWKSTKNRKNCFLNFHSICCYAVRMYMLIIIALMNVFAIYYYFIYPFVLVSCEQKEELSKALAHTQLLQSETENRTPSKRIDSYSYTLSHTEEWEKNSLIAYVTRCNVCIQFIFIFFSCFWVHIAFHKGMAAALRFDALQIKCLIVFLFSIFQVKD